MHFSTWTLGAAVVCWIIPIAMGVGAHDGGVAILPIFGIWLILLSVPLGIVDAVRCHDRRSKVQLGVAVILSLAMAVLGF
jgi:hypothetical protein